jgi:hypothetical protein
MGQEAKVMTKPVHDLKEIGLEDGDRDQRPAKSVLT